MTGSLLRPTWLPATAWLLLSQLAAVPIAVGVPGPPDPDPPSAERPIDFNRDIRPILSDRCFKCHGFDETKRARDLRLDTWEGLTTEGSRGAPVVPGDPDASSLVLRVEHSDPKRVMPPSSSGLSLNDEEKARIRRWIAEGASFADHWAFVPPRDVDVSPSPIDNWSRNELDVFVLDRLFESGLVPSPPADPETLLRRVTYDLTGLPPTLDEIDAFLEDPSDEAYERVVDRLLDSPRFGERMALMWLDAARYADTNGFHHDNIRTIWPYRDWVIRSFNENLPYDQFVIEQLAGDLLPNPTEDQRIATAFCRLHNINDEGGALDEEYRVEAVADRIETVGTVFLGLTMNCARCHDHKYDPITQDDYYSLFAFFNSIDERGVYSNNFEQARAYPARILYAPEDLEERIEDGTLDLEDAEAELAEATPLIQAEFEGWDTNFRKDRSIEWVEATLVEAKTASGAGVEEVGDGSLRISGEIPAEDSHTFVFETDARDLRVLRLEALKDAAHVQGRTGLSSNGNVVLTSVRARATPLRDAEPSQDLEWTWAWADHEQPNGDFDVANTLNADSSGWAFEGHNLVENRTALFVSEEGFGFEGGTRLEVTLEYKSPHSAHIAGRPRISFAKGQGELENDFPTIFSDWWMAGPFSAENFDEAYDRAFGPEEVTRIDRHQRFAEVGWSHRADIEEGTTVSLSGERSAFYFARTIRTPQSRDLHVSLGSDDAIRVFLNGEEKLGNKALRGVAPDQESLGLALPPGENLLVVKIINNGGPGGFYASLTQPKRTPDRLLPLAFVPPEARDPDVAYRLRDSWGRSQSPTYVRLSDAVEQARQSLEALKGETVPVLVMKELDQPKQAFVLTRGQYDAPDKDRPVSRRPPERLGGTLPTGAPSNRLGFARWLVDAQNPLTSRVHVNRIWQMIFGRGLVATAENFGQQASWPSHLDLLDWLSKRFVHSGWDQKALLRLMVRSATYRQASQIPSQSRELDPENHLLSHFPRQRLPGELIRDSVLSVSGLLTPRIGGPSVKPYQPAGLWREVSIGSSSNTQSFKRDEGLDLYRRSLYTFWKRTSPNPQMRAFDSPTREFCVVRRNTTNTPLQTLVLWNDVQFLEAARLLALRTLEEFESREERLISIYRRCTGRRPENAELAVLESELEHFLSRYRQDPSATQELLGYGEAHGQWEDDPAAHAAWMMIASTLFSLDRSLVRD